MWKTSSSFLCLGTQNAMPHLIEGVFMATNLSIVPDKKTLRALRKAEAEIHADMFGYSVRTARKWLLEAERQGIIPGELTRFGFVANQETEEQRREFSDIFGDDPKL